MENKFILVYKNIFPNRKRIIGKYVDIGVLYSEARLERTIKIEGNQALEAGVSAARIIASNNLAIANPNNQRATYDSDQDYDNEEEDVNEDSHASNGYNMAQGFRKFQRESHQVAKSQGLFINGNLQQLLALDNILLLVKNQHSKEILLTMEDVNLTCYHEDMKQNFLDLNLTVDDEILLKLMKALTKVDTCTRKEIKCCIHKFYEFADDYDTKILNIFLNFIDKLPEEPILNHQIKEIELVTRFLDPIMSAVLADVEQNRVFSWTNTASTGTENEHPDGEMATINQRSIAYHLGYCEVKVSEGDSSSVYLHYDMLRLARFGKKLCHNEDLRGSLLVMAVGFRVRFFILTRNKPFDTMFEIANMELPKSLSTLASFTSNVHKIKQILQAYYTHCTKEPEISLKRKKESSMTKNDIQQVINTSKPKKMKASLSFK
ncbi:hypothetical protein J3Q64DRAFT_1721792 [Phycomyces blakesleeanus]